ncbi:MAG: dCTP deaminase [Candidatus Aminicenantes bacterium]|nr:dCTP deaminase [Candidatus Aminicenantes bacterium]
MLKSSRWIKEQAEKHRLLEPFVATSVRSGVVSYGLGPYGYDLRLDRTYRRPSGPPTLIDPHQADALHFETRSEDVIVIPPGHFILGRSMEYFRMPKKILGLAFGKSTYARCGVLVNVTPLEPEWTGFLTISIANCGAWPAAVHPGQGIAQVIFIESSDPPLRSYKDLNGKYDGQDEVTVARIQQR